MKGASEGLEAVKTDRAPKHVTFFSQAIRVGNLLFTSGIPPRDPKTNKVPESFDEQVILVFESLKAIAEAAGTTLQKAVKVNVYLRDIGNWDRMNEYFKRYFNGEPPPARTTVEVGLRENYQIEVDAVFYIP